MSPVLWLLVSPLFLTAGSLMVLVGASPCLWWRSRSGAAWRWFTLGAGVWSVSVALKILWAVSVNQALFELLRRSLAPGLYLLIGAAYIGLVSALFEMGFAWWMARREPRLGEGFARAAAFGLGAGGFEAIVIGSLVLLAGFLDPVPSGTTPLLWLVGPAERVIAVCCHVACRLLVIRGVRAGDGVQVLAGALLFTALDGTAGYLVLSGCTEHWNLWWVELCFLPFALLSAVVILRLHRAPWPEGPAGG